jgi:hypothetical protein
VQSGKYKRLTHGQPVYQLGDACTTFYVVLSGRVGIHSADTLPTVHHSKMRVGRSYATLPTAEEAAALADNSADESGENGALNCHRCVLPMRNLHARMSSTSDDCTCQV